MKSRGRWIVLVLVAILVVAMALAAGCGEKEEKTEETKEPTSTTVQSEVGDGFTVRLESNPSTGFAWVVGQQPDTKVVELNGSVFAGGGSKPGTPGHQLFMFKSVGEGSTKVVLDYERPWEKDTPPAKTYTVDVTVAGKDVAEVKTFTDPNAPVDVVVGQEFLIALESNPSTGYGWVLGATPDANLVLEAKGFTAEEGVLIGAGGKEYWRFDAEAAGTFKLVFNYVRPWEKDVAPAKTATFTVNVK